TVVNNQNSKIINFPENREDYGKKIETTTINNYIRSIKVFYNYLYENRYITTNPVVRIKEIKCVRKVIGFIDDSNFNRLLKIFDLSKFHEYRDYIVAQLIFDTGMRLGETLLIEETDIDFTKRTILLKAENTK
ncbi:MAG: tyrosine-type recombinase/integrase, partial [Clostridia bacterium]